MYTAKTPAIDKLPTALKQQVVDAILAGKSLRQVASLAGVSHVTVKDYRDKVVAPAVEAARQIQQSKSVATNLSIRATETAALTQTLAAADPIIAEIQRIRSERLEVQSEARADGEYGAWASMDRNNLSAIELEARLAGRLDSGSKTQVNVMVFSGMPPDWATGHGDNRSQGSQDDVIDIESVNITPGSPDQT
jgi:hypothetical protein